MKPFLTQIFIFLALTVNAQQILTDLSNYKATVLDNGLTVITVKTSQFDYVNYRLVFDYNPADEKQPGAVDFLIAYLGLSRLSPTQFYTTKVSDTNAVDSMFRFIKHNIFEPVFETKKIEFTKKTLKQHIENQHNTLTEHEHLSDKFCFGFNSIYSQYPDIYDINNLSGRTLQSLYVNIIRPKSAYVIAVGNVEHDTIVKYAKQNFNSWSGSTNTTPIPQPNNNLQTKIYFKNNTTKTFVSISYPTTFNYNEQYFFEKIILSNIFEKRLDENSLTYCKSINYTINPVPFGQKFYVSMETSPDMVYDAIISATGTIRDMVIYPVNAEKFTKAKADLSKKFTNSLVNPYNIAQYAYIEYKYNLPTDFFQNYIKNINAIKINDLQPVAKKFFKPDNAAIFIQGNYDELICPLYRLAKFYRVDFFDADFRKYKIIPQGFDCRYIIADYLKFCNAGDKIRNLTIKFSVQYNADTIYNVKGIIYKKTPNFYYYKTELILSEDTLLQRLQIANNEVWLDSTALGAKYYKEDEFWIRIYQAYIFPEMYYKEIGYTPELVCDTALMKQNKFKFKITTPYNFYIYDYYDFNLKQKYRTETIIPRGSKEDTVQIVEYSDYKSIKYGKIAHNTLDSTLMAKDLYGKTSDIKMPFTITQQINGFQMIMKIDEIDDSKKINKKIFEFEKPQTIDTIPNRE